MTNLFCGKSLVLGAILAAAILLFSLPGAAGAQVQPTCSLNVSPTYIENTPSTVTLSWSTANAHTIFIDNDIGFVSGGSGSRAITVTSDRTFNLYATGAGGTNTCTATVTTRNGSRYSAPTCSIYAEPRVTGYNGEVTLHWTSSADTVEASLNQSIGGVQKSGSRVVRDITDARTYTLTVKNADRTDGTCSTTVYVDKALPTCSLTASSGYVRRGEATTLSWSLGNASTANIVPDIGAVPQSGTHTVRPNTTTTYRMTAQNVIGSRTCETTVNVYDGLLPPYSPGTGQGSVVGTLPYTTHPSANVPRYSITAAAVPLTNVPYTGPNDVAYVLVMLALALSAFGGLYFLYRRTWRSAYAL
ncbi:MAG: hypothetical protein Q8P16_00205 [bacterium]|nr:hypothetical protein [bacterium]